MQLVRRHADGMRDLLDFGLGAPVFGDVGDRAAHDRVVVVGAHQDAEIGQAVGGQHGGLRGHVHACYLVP